MSVIKVVDLAYVRIQVPDLDKAEQFFRDFGFIISARTPTSVHARAHDAERLSSRNPGRVACCRSLSNVGRAKISIAWPITLAQQ
jgi:hypothetical protein